GESVNCRCTISLVKELRQVARLPVEVILAMAMIRIPAFELALEKTVEVGVTQIVPFTAARSNVAPGHRHDRWTRILVEAVKQSKHYYLPRLNPPVSFAEVLSIPARSKIMFAEREGWSLGQALTGS